MNPFRLYQISEEVRQLLDWAVDEDTGEINELFDQSLEALLVQRDQIAIDAAAYIKEQQALVAGISSEIKRLERRVTSAQKRVDSAKKAICWAIEPGTRMEDERAAISWRKSTSVEIKDGAYLPPEYIKEYVEQRPMKAEIKKALKEGKTVPGAQLVEKNNLQVK